MWEVSFDEHNIIMDGEVAHYPTSSLSKGTKQTFHLFFPTSYVSELKKEGLIAPQSGFEVEETDYSFVGEWTSNWGDMKFERSGDQIIGEYTHDKGKLVGVVNGDVFIGTWSESPSYTGPNDAGDVELKLSPDGNSFTGNWRYGSEGATWSGGWTGQRK